MPRFRHNVNETLENGEETFRHVYIFVVYFHKNLIK